MMNSTHLRDLLHTVTIFAGVSEAGFDRLCGQCSVIECEENEVFIREGTPAQEIYILLEGAVKIVLDIDNEPLELIMLGAGDCIGETSVIGIQKHSASAVVIEKATMLVLSRDVLMNVYNTDKELFALLILNIARELARRLYKTNKTMLAYKHAIAAHGLQH